MKLLVVRSLACFPSYILSLTIVCMLIMFEPGVDALYRRVERDSWSRRDPMQADAQWQLRKGHGGPGGQR